MSQMREPAPPVDLRVLPELTGCDEDMVGEFLQDFLEVADTAVSDMAAALQASDLARLREAAHRVKSSARYVGAVELGRLSEAIEYAARDGQGPQATQLLSAWQSEFLRVDDFIAGVLDEAPDA